MAVSGVVLMHGENCACLLRYLPREKNRVLPSLVME